MKTHTERCKTLVKPLLIATSVASVPGVALAQERVLEEIVVTAEHREASLQETQISLSAFSASAIAELGISNGLDLGEYVPNLNAQPFVGGRTGVSYNIRGIGNAETLITFDPAVSVYIDGVLIAKNTGSLLDVLELERIEVLRGPQGTLYGRNTMGGAVNYITQKPSNEFEGSLKATVGKFGQRDLRGMLNMPLLDASSPVGELNLRVSAASIQRDGTQKNSFAGAPQRDLGTKDREVAMMHLMWRPTDDVSVTYSYDRTRIDEHQETAWVTGTNPSSFFGPQLVPWQERENKRPRGGEFNSPHNAITDVDGHALTLVWDISENLSLHSLTGYRTMENFGDQDSDGSPLPLLYTRDAQENESFSQEFRLLGSAWGDRLNYSVGLFFMDEEGDVFNDTVAIGNSTVNIANYTNEAWAVYGQATYDITDRLDVTLGVRYTEEDREMEKAVSVGAMLDHLPYLDDIRPIFAGNTCSGAGSQPCAGTVFPKASEKFYNVSPMISVSYDWTDDIMTYFKVSSGYQSGGFNARDATWEDFVTGFDEETILAYELGMKSLLAGRYQLNGALWFSDYDDKRVNQFNPETLASIQRNAGVVEIWGVEVELLAQLTDNLQAGVNYGYVDHKYAEYDFENADGTISDLSKASNFPYSPRNTASAHLAYDYPLERAVVKARLDWSYRDNMTFLVPKPERNSSGPVQLWNARLTLDEIQGPGDSSLRISLWGKNLTNESYWNFGVNIYETFGFDINTYGEPRTFGADFEIRF